MNSAPNTASAARVTIIGAGVFGRVLAFAALQRGMRVHVLDREPLESRNGTGFIAGGMLAPTLEVDSGEAALFELGASAPKLWSEICAKLGRPELCIQHGSLLIGIGPDRVLAQEILGRIEARIGGQADFERLDAARLAELAPALNPRVRFAAYFPREAHLINDLVLAALGEALAQHPDFTFERRSIEGPFEALPKPQDGTWFIDCRGYSRDFAAKGLRGVRGEIIKVRARQHGLRMPVRLAHPRFPIYIVPKADDVLTIGATSIESSDAKALTVRSGLELLSGLYASFPALGEAEILSLDTGVRPAFPSHLPRVEVCGSALMVNGFHRHGLLLSPLFAGALVDHMLGARAIRESEVKRCVVSL